MTVYRVRWANGRSAQRDTLEEAVELLAAECPPDVAEARIVATSFLGARDTDEGPQLATLVRSECAARRDPASPSGWAFGAFGPWTGNG